MGRKLALEKVADMTTHLGDANKHKSLNVLEQTKFSKNRDSTKLAGRREAASLTRGCRERGMGRPFWKQFGSFFKKKQKTKTKNKTHPQYSWASVPDNKHFGPHERERKRMLRFYF